MSVPVTDATTTISAPYNPAEVSRLIQRIGMNAIAHGDPLGPTTRQIRPYLRSPTRRGRNSPRPCGSGRKYKKCHWGN